MIWQIHLKPYNRSSIGLCVMGRWRPKNKIHISTSWNLMNWWTKTIPQIVAFPFRPHSAPEGVKVLRSNVQWNRSTCTAGQERPCKLRRKSNSVEILSDTKTFQEILWPVREYIWKLPFYFVIHTKKRSGPDPSSSIWRTQAASRTCPCWVNSTKDARCWLLSRRHRFVKIWLAIEVVLHLYTIPSRYNLLSQCELDRWKNLEGKSWQNKFIFAFLCFQVCIRISKWIVCLTWSLLHLFPLKMFSAYVAIDGIRQQGKRADAVQRPNWSCMRVKKALKPTVDLP